MPVDLRVGKMLLFGALLGCVDPVLTIAAAMSLSRPPFLSPMEQRAEANAARAYLCTEKSDQLALLRAYEGWSAALNAGGAGAARRFANAHFLSVNGMDELHGIRAQLSSTLAAIGLPRSTAEAAGGVLDGIREMHQVNLVRSLVCAGLYPNVAKVRAALLVLAFGHCGCSTLTLPTRHAA
jgi:ATP-dependent RNA helicase DHX57